MEVREANRNDVEALAALARETYAYAFGHSLSSSDLAAHLERHLSPRSFERIVDEDTVMLAESAGRLIGFVQFGDAGDEQRALRRLYVHSEFQNRGTGTLLMNAALNHPMLKSADSIYLDVWEHNHGALRFYRRYGFEVIGEQAFEVESGADTSVDLVMVRRRPKTSDGRS